MNVALQASPRDSSLHGAGPWSQAARATDCRPLASAPADTFVRSPYASATPQMPRPLRAVPVPDALARPRGEVHIPTARTGAGALAAAVLVSTLGASIASPALVASPPLPSASVSAPAQPAVGETGSRTEQPVFARPSLPERNPVVEKAWQEAGGAGGPLGNPTADLVDNGPSSWGTRSHEQAFEGGAIVLHDNGKFEGKAFAVSGPMAKLYREKGGARSGLGLPTGPSWQSRPSYYGTTSEWQKFEGGIVVHTTDGEQKGTVNTVRWLMFDDWAAVGGTQSFLGLPTSNDRMWNGGLRQDFEGGFLFRSIHGRVTMHPHQ